MPNTFLTPTQVLREALRVLHNNLVFVRNANRQYSKEFAIAGAKVGATINVRLPNKYYVTKATALAAQNTTESTVPVQLTTNYQVGLNFTQQELTLSLDDFSKRIITPAMAKLSAQIDLDGLTMYQNVYNFVGTAGTTPGTPGFVGADPMYNYTSPNVFLNAGAMLDSMATPTKGRGCVLAPFAMAGSVAGLSGLVNDQETVGRQYIDGMMSKALGLEFAMDQNVNLLTTGTRAGTHGVAGNFTADSAGQTGSNLTVKWITDPNTGNTIAQGEVIMIAGVYSVNPENQVSTGKLARFVVTATTTMPVAGTDFTLPISPAIVVAGTGVANGTVTAAPGAGAIITILTSISATAALASQVFPQNMAYHPDAFTLATADLEMPHGVDFAARETYEGISMLIVRAYDINYQQFPCRVDVLAGWAALRPELACRITG